MNTAAAKVKGIAHRWRIARCHLIPFFVCSIEHIWSAAHDTAEKIPHSVFQIVIAAAEIYPMTEMQFLCFGSVLYHSEINKAVTAIGNTLFGLLAG